MHLIHHRYADVDGQRLFYQEAGPAGAPAVVLLHGFPASSFMFRDLIPLLAGRYHVIAPDYLGFGLSAAPPASEFAYTFDALATPDAISAVITQNGNGYDEGFTEGFWKPLREYWQDRNPQTEAAVRQALTLEAIRWQYLHGVPDETVVSPETWQHDFTQVSRPGNDQIQLALLADYATNPPLYPRLHAWLRDSRVPVLAVWGRNDEIFAPEGALAFAADASGAEICLLDGGHFLLESHLDAAVSYIHGFLGRTLT